MDKVRLDKYLWAIRIFKTRTSAATAIDAGKVKLKGEVVKSSRTVVVGDVYDIKTEARKWTIQVIGIIEKRVQYTEAIKHYTDLTSEEDIQYNKRLTTSFYTGKRQSKIGRPTKKERRDLDSFMDDDAPSE